jgi:hypothetical protein
LDELNFSRSAHKSFLVSSHLTRHKRKKKIILFVIFSSQSQTPVADRRSAPGVWRKFRFSWIAYRRSFFNLALRVSVST